MVDKFIKNIKNKRMKLFSSFAYFLPVSYLIKKSKINHIFPFYHAISDSSPQHLQHLYKVRTTKEFIGDLDFMQKYYKAASLCDIAENSENKFFLSFDDGLSEIFNIVAPILKTRNIPCTFFINPDFIDNTKMFYKHKASIIVEKLSKEKNDSVLNKILEITENQEISGFVLGISYSNSNLLDEIAKILKIDFDEYLSENKPYLQTNQINQLIEQGFTIGSHSIDHPLYSGISEQEQIQQTKESINLINQKFGIQTDFFSFPFTDFGVKNNFFEEIFNNTSIKFTFGTAGIKLDSQTRNIQRIPVENLETKAEFHVKAQYIDYILKRLINKHIIWRT